MKDNPVSSITEIPPTLWNFALKDLYHELDTKRILWQSMGAGVNLPKWYSKETLQNILCTLSKWHRDEFGDRAIGLTYTGRETDRIVYDKNDPETQQLRYECIVMCCCCV